MSDADATTFRPVVGDSGKEIESLKASHALALSPGHPPTTTWIVTWPPETPKFHTIETIPGGRRPTVAVVDTGIDTDHEWFQSTVADVVNAADQGWRAPSAADLAHTTPAADSDTWPVTDPDYTWHGTFVTGLVRQMAPDARILSVQLRREVQPREVVGGKRGVEDGQILEAFTWLRERTAGPSAEFVDVICLAIGYRQEHSDHYTDDLEQVIRDLCRRGVLVVAAAGNRSAPVDIPDLTAIDTSDQPKDAAVFPAKLADHLNPRDGLPILAVGADMPGHKPADFSPQEAWVKHREVAWDEASAAPTDPDWWARLVADATHGQPVDNFPLGFGHGSGTSFAAAKFAGRLAAAMLAESGASTGSSLADTTAVAAIERAKRAIKAADKQLKERSGTPA